MRSFTSHYLVFVSFQIFQLGQILFLSLHIEFSGPSVGTDKTFKIHCSNIFQNVMLTWFVHIFPRQVMILWMFEVEQGE